MQSEGVPVATFGAGAKDHLDVVDNIKGIESKLLSHLYNRIVHLFPLLNKSRYRYVFYGIGSASLWLTIVPLEKSLVPTKTISLSVTLR